MDSLKVYGTRWCGDCLRAKAVLNERQVPYEWIDIDKNSEGEKLVKETNHGNRSVPTIIFPDATVLVEPSNQVLNEKLDLFQF